jgi:UDP-N-acetylglucosamine--N-acetylmuramyl-(pentapeptide) pyrophosphoryl-undecaprenol N-acetylglucosamine transferase
MRMVLAGGGTGGHFYPLIAVAEAIEDITLEKTLIEPELYYIGPEPFDKAALAEHDIRQYAASAGKMRREGGFSNVLSFIPTFFGVLSATYQLYKLYPDVVFSTGGYAAFPVLYAARLLHIPVVIYDADATPGRVSLWSSKFALWIAVAHADAALKFPKKVHQRIASVGHPIRKEITGTAKEGGHEFLKVDPAYPTIFIMGGSQGARAINEVVLDALKDLVTRYNIVHQTGTANLQEVSGIASVILKDSLDKEHYRCFGLLNTLAIRMAAGIASVIVARAGSGTIFEIASWGVPAILIPIPMDVSHDQTENAFSYARSGGAEVIEQKNLSPHILSAEIDRLMQDPALREKMGASAKKFAKPDAARKIAEILIETAIAHEPA